MNDISHENIEQAVECRVDNWLDEMATNDNAAQRINTELDLYDGLLLPFLLRLIARWSGSTEDALRTLKDMHNILCDELEAKARMQIENERRDPIR